MFIFFLHQNKIYVWSINKLWDASACKTQERTCNAGVGVENLYIKYLLFISKVENVFSIEKSAEICELLI